MQHPAAKLLVMASKMQEAEVGDGTNLVVVLAGELLVLAEDLLKNGLHCSEIIAGYTSSLAKALEELDKCVCYSAPKSALHDPIELAKALKHVIAWLDSRRASYSALLGSSRYQGHGSNW